MTIAIAATAAPQNPLNPLDAALADAGAAIARGEQDKLAAAFAAATLMEVSSHRGTETQSGNSGATPETPNPKPASSFLLGEKALEVPGTGGRNEWLEPVTDEAYNKATVVK